MRKRNDENVEDDEENRESTAIKLGRDLGKSKKKATIINISIR
mgnify:FL=1